MLRKKKMTHDEMVENCLDHFEWSKRDNYYILSEKDALIAKENAVQFIHLLPLPTIKTIPFRFRYWAWQQPNYHHWESKLPQLYKAIRFIMNGYSYYTASSSIARIICTYLRGYNKNVKFTRIFYHCNPMTNDSCMWAFDLCDYYHMANPVIQFPKYQCRHPAITILCKQHDLPNELASYIYNFMLLIF